MATHAERVLDYLWSIAPEGATNGDIARTLGIRSHQSVYMLTQQLMRSGRIQGQQVAATWLFHATEDPAASLGLPPWTTDVPAAARFEARARDVLAKRYGVGLLPGSVPGIPKRFDYVSTVKQIVGDAKYFARVGSMRLPPAKFSIIAEYVWLLEKTGAAATFLVFGNDREVPVRWLARYGELASGVTFYFLTDADGLEVLAGPGR